MKGYDIHLGRLYLKSIYQDIVSISRQGLMRTLEVRCIHIIFSTTTIANISNILRHLMKPTFLSQG
jgi:hypothetical protein